MKKQLQRVLTCVIVLMMCATMNLVTPALATTSSEAKIYCDATIEDNFDPQTVVVTMKQNVQNIHKQYSLQDFPEIDAVGFSKATFQPHKNSKP